MLSDSQRLYIEEVLGTTEASYRMTARATLEIAPGPVEPERAPAVVATIVVLTPPLEDPARALLQKILASVKLTDFVHVEGDRPVAAKHVLHFAAGAIPGRSTTAHGSSWGFHDLDRLLGPAAEVANLKREVWSLLQIFARDVL